MNQYLSHTNTLALIAGCPFPTISMQDYRSLNAINKMIVDKTAQLHRYNNDTSSAIGAEKKYKIVDDNAHIHIQEFKDNKLINVFILNYIDDNFIGYEEVINKYDKNNQLVSCSRSTYDINNHFTYRVVSHYNTRGELVNTVKTLFEYDSSDVMTGSLELKYDANNQLIQKVKSKYDITERGMSIRKREFNYDTSGLMISSSEAVYNDQGLLTYHTQSEYNANKKMVKQINSEFDYDPKGRLLTEHQIHYDADNQPTEYVKNFQD